MLGDQLGESKGKRVVRRILSVDPLTAEVTFEDGGQMLGVPAAGTGTYASVIRPDGSIYGEYRASSRHAGWRRHHLDGPPPMGGFGPGFFSPLSWHVGITAPPRKSWRAQQCFSRIWSRSRPGAGNTVSQAWEWKSAEAAKGKSA